MLDLILAVLHHLLIFALFGVLFAELIIVRHGMDLAAVIRVAAFDRWYGILAGLILVVGFSRADFAAKGWLYYSQNVYFWAKLGTFAVIGLLSVMPTIAFVRWRRTNTVPAAELIAAVHRYLWIELGLFALLPAFAAAMARGYGAF